MGRQIVQRRLQRDVEKRVEDSKGLKEQTMSTKKQKRREERMARRDGRLRDWAGKKKREREKTERCCGEWERYGRSGARSGSDWAGSSTSRTTLLGASLERLSPSRGDSPTTTLSTLLVELNACCTTTGLVMSGSRCGHTKGGDARDFYANTRKCRANTVITNDWPAYSGATRPIAASRLAGKATTHTH